MTTGCTEEGLALYVLRAHGLSGAGAYGRLLVLQYLVECDRPATFRQILEAHKSRRIFRWGRVEREVEVLRRAGLVCVPMARTAEITEKGRQVWEQLQKK